MPTDRRAVAHAPWRGLALLALSVAMPALAQPPPDEEVRVVVSVEADPTCATTAALAQLVRRRSRRIRFVEAAPDVLHVRIRLTGGRADRRGPQRQAVLSMQWPDGTSAERRLRAHTCAAALDALGLLLVMTLDDTADIENAQPHDGSETPLPVTREDGSRSQAEGAPGDEAPAPAAEGEGAPQTDAAGRKESAAGSVGDIRHEASPPGDLAHTAPFDVAALSLAASGYLLLGPAPRALPGIGLRAFLTLEGSGLWRPALGLRLAHTWVRDRSQPGGQASFDLTLAALDLCPLGTQLGPLTAHACVTASAGRLGARGHNSYTPQAHSEPWASLGGALSVALAVAGPVELHAGFDLMAPLTRYRFAFRPTIFHRVPALVPAGHAGLGVRFP